MNLREIFQTGLTSSIVIIFLYVKIISAQDPILEAECTQWTTSDGLSAANCSTDFFTGIKQDYFRIPRSLSGSLQVIDLRPKSDNAYSGVFIEAGMFKPYPQLKRILMKKNFQILSTSTSTNINRKEAFSNMMATIFTDLSSLEYLEMNECYLGKWIPVPLPSKLKMLNFDNNRYPSLDVHWAADLQELSVKENYLNNIPKFSVPSPPLKILRLNDNPLADMTVIDIAHLCEITLLELHFPSNAHYVNEDGYCQCVMLKKWANETKLKGLENVSCFDSANKSNCSENILEEARKIRKKCPLLPTDNAASTAIKKGLKYTFMLTMLGLLIAALILYIIRHFHLREYWAAHHLRMAHAEASASTIDEGEEEPFKSLEESQDSSVGDAEENEPF